MSTPTPKKLPWAIVQAQHRNFAIATEYVSQILLIPNVTAVPGAPPYVRGVIELRGRVFPLVDLRLRLGLIAMAAEGGSFCNLMSAREQDHHRWLAELRRSVEERRAFTLATDPHKCAFGKWYDAFRTDDAWLGALLKKFDQPHRTLHALAVRVKDFQDQGLHDAAAELVSGDGVNVLNAMVQLFGELRTTIQGSCREMVLALLVDGRPLALTVDSVVAIDNLQPEELPPGANPATGGVVHCVGRRASSNDMVLIVEADRLLSREAIDRVLSMSRQPAAVAAPAALPRSA
ncbi:MAG: chemotaxis protein CheW [Acidobacteriota bacterium]|nr:chemotaxis protein CheW [Acidobacteriota bacterium]